MRTARILVSVTLMGLLGGPVFEADSAAAEPTAEWPRWRGPNRDGKSPGTNLLKEWPAGGP